MGMRHIVIEPGRRFLDALRDYRRAADHLLSGSVSEAKFAEYYEKMMAIAHEVGEINPVLVDLPQDLDLPKTSEAFLKHEVQIVADTFGLSSKRSAKIVLRADNLCEGSAAPSALVQALAENHATFLRGYHESMERMRKEKKRRRRQIIAALEQTIAGSVVMAANVMTIGHNPYVKESVTLGGGLVIKAYYDIRRG